MLPGQMSTAICRRIAHVMGLIDDLPRSTVVLVLGGSWNPFTGTHLLEKGTSTYIR